MPLHLKCKVAELEDKACSSIFLAWIKVQEESSCLEEHQPSWPMAHYKKGGVGTNCSIKVQIGFFSTNFYFSVFFKFQYQSAPDPVCSLGVTTLPAFLLCLLRGRSSSAQMGQSHEEGPQPSGDLGSWTHFLLAKKINTLLFLQKPLEEVWLPCVSGPFGACPEPAWGWSPSAVGQRCGLGDSTVTSLRQDLAWSKSGCSRVRQGWEAPMAP